MRSRVRGNALRIVDEVTRVLSECPEAFGVWMFSCISCGGTEIPLNPPLRKGEGSSSLWVFPITARQFPPFGKGGTGGICRTNGSYNPRSENQELTVLYLVRGSLSKETLARAMVSAGGRSRGRSLNLKCGDS